MILKLMGVTSFSDLGQGAILSVAAMLRAEVLCYPIFSPMYTA